MYKEHPLFEAPEQEQTLWRFLDFTKFVSLLDRSALFFPRADQLGDPFEGSFSNVNVDVRPNIYKENLEDIQKLALIHQQLPRFTLVSCWHGNDFESAAMWRLYGREHDGIAIRTNFKSLSESLLGPEDVFIGKVRYVDFSQTFIPEGNSMGPFLFKRMSFEHEREVRALMQDIPLIDGVANVAQPVRATGRYHETDLSKLIHEIVTSPFAQEWFEELVKSVANRYGLQAPVKRSSLAEQPVWG